MLEFLKKIWGALTSPVAIIVYIAIIFVVLLLVLLSLIIRNRRDNLELEERKKNDLITRDDKFINTVTESVKNSTDALEKKIEIQSEKIDLLNRTGLIATTISGKGSSKGQTETKVVGEDGKEISHSDSTRFFMLNEIDKKMKNYKAPEYDNEVTLEEICVRFRNYASGEKKLYYDIKDIRRFIAGLSVTKLLILQGMSGTGKTSLAFAFGEFLQNQTVVVPIQPMWKERTDLIGYYNEFTKKFNETTLLNKMYEANTNKNIYITVLDEMNIARVEYYFAEFLSLLELPKPEARNLDVVSDVWDTDPVLLHEGKLRLPINMWFIGTANNDDSTFAISDKVYDRAMVLNLDTKAEEFDSKEHRTLSLSIDHLYDLFDKAQKEFEISERNLRRIRKLDKFLINTFKITFGNRIMKQIRAYVPVVVACGGTELEAIDDILSRKVLRKLESKNPVYVRSQSENLIKQINDLFGQDVMTLCIDVIQSIEQNM